MNIENMTDEEKRVKIAEANGFARHRAIKNPFHAYLRRPEWTMEDWELCDGSEKQTNADFCPDYLNDLNAMHEAEKTLSREQFESYAFWLAHTAPLGTQISATARQRVDAILLSLP